MIKKISFLLLIFAFSAPIAKSQQALSKDKKMEWWREARFGMFIHFGVYAQLAGEYNGHQQTRGGAEWIMNRMKIPVAEYKAIAEQFNPVKFNADEWVRMAKDAGMKYLVITAKHHDGFALFDSKASDWDIADATPYKKDLLKPLAAACKKYGIKLGFYYSQAQDWGNPGGAAARRGVAEGWANPDSTQINNYTLAHKGHWDPAQETSTFAQYIDRVAVPQVKELMTNYGDVAVLWWDTPTNMTDDAALKLQTQLKLQPNIITNDRLKRPNFPGDTKTPEQKIPNLSELDGQDWETCMTMNGTWGFRNSDTNWKSSTTLIHNLVDIASKGGNYLLNVGPKPDGSFPEASVERLKDLGGWMKIYSEAIYATQASPIPDQAWGRITRKDLKNGNTTLYFSVFDWPENGELVVKGLKNEVVSAQLLNNNNKVSWTKAADEMIFKLPISTPNEVASVIKVEVKGKMQTWFGELGKEKMKTGSID
ncbi:alpha-L-fucosidase [Pedobacter sp. ISL-68]|uniref:alpha-L-fucosidase n=1 Tax=unclassified Pedobacter TaxID=2628915 RepID=UPI001BEABA51|nr:MULTISPECIES: alpha-L-fucosidase [unclassified Pedobacter]MBT2560682.1 alpha-L-fucosidase [Pedobacter sp. ISL-64]MBT2590061.1 alpha-L-fucosidase [Pedobacter sp. ISL-68]